MEETDPTTKRIPLPIHVQKPTPYTFDLGLLLASDPNPLVLSTPSELEQDLANTARDGAQALLNQLLSTCPIASTPNGVLLSLPGIETNLPREKPLPPPKAQTTWQKFAAKKGIAPKTAETRKKLVYDEATGEWVPKWGYKGKNKEGEGDWIVEVDEKAERERRAAGKTGGGVRGGGKRKGGCEKEEMSARMGGLKREERKERVKRNERLMRANERKGRKNGAK